MTEKKINDGGPAFPRSAYSVQDDWDMAEGMSKREWFAGMALQGLLSDPHAHGGFVVARAAFEYADAMLAESEKGK